MADQKREEPIIIKKIKKGGHAAHHGGAWKVAYADFVTAMMAFFLVMWVMGLSVKSKKAIAGYFEKPGVFSFMTGKALPVDMENKMARYQLVKDASSVSNYSEKGGEQDYIKDEKIIKAIADSNLAAQELIKKGKEFQDKLEATMTQNPGLKELESSIKFEVSNEGLRIELLESRESVFFEVGSAKLKKESKQLIKKLAEEIGKLPNPVQVEGHTDSRPFSDNGYTNWELSADRANASRKILEDNGLWENQISKVTGYADRKPRSPENPFDISNRRISILLEYMKTDTFIAEEKK